MPPAEPQLLTFRERRQARARSASYQLTTMSMFLFTAGAWLGGGAIAFLALYHWVLDPSKQPGGADISAMWLIATGTITLLMATDRRRSTLNARSTKHCGKRS